MNLKPLSSAPASVRSAERLGAAKQSPVTTTSWAAKNHHLAKLKNIPVNRFQEDERPRGENVLVKVHILRWLLCFYPGGKQLGSPSP